MTENNPGAGRTKVYSNPREMLADSTSNNSDAAERERNGKTAEHPSTTSGN